MYGSTSTPVSSKAPQLQAEPESEKGESSMLGSVLSVHTTGKRMQDKADQGYSNPSGQKSTEQPTSTSGTTQTTTDSRYTEQSQSTAGALAPGTAVSRLKADDDASTMSLKSGVVGPYADGTADHPPVGVTGETSDQTNTQ